MDRESPPLDGLVRNILGVHSRELLDATMAKAIFSSILNAQGIDPLDLVDNSSFDQSSDSDGDSAIPIK